MTGKEIKKGPLRNSERSFLLSSGHCDGIDGLIAAPGQLPWAVEVFHRVASYGIPGKDLKDQRDLISVLDGFLFAQGHKTCGAAGGRSFFQLPVF